MACHWWTAALPKREAHARLDVEGLWNFPLILECCWVNVEAWVLLGTSMFCLKHAVDPRPRHCAVGADMLRDRLSS